MDSLSGLLRIKKSGWVLAANVLQALQSPHALFEEHNLCLAISLAISFLPRPFGPSRVRTFELNSWSSF